VIYPNNDSKNPRLGVNKNPHLAQLLLTEVTSVRQVEHISCPESVSSKIIPPSVMWWSDIF
jgi:hypothetical protein